MVQMTLDMPYINIYLRRYLFLREELFTIYFLLKRSVIWSTYEYTCTIIEL